ncbi:lytic transglycosylase domain-containing protein [Robbsia andropogonis]|uniref:lytic transglycosylase domain-containing protein n=1 Tax=Robbsia andropogonis TaxID=28092 RepID=UPI003F50ADA9
MEQITLQKKRQRMRWRRALLLIGLSMPVAAWADCFDAAAAYQGVNPMVLRAIAWVESRGNPNAEHHNENGTVDIGELQINSIHLPELRTYGVSMRALRNECVNIYVAAWHLKKQIVRYGNNWNAVGAYHSAIPHLRDEYAALVRGALRHLDAIPHPPWRRRNVSTYYASNGSNE